MDTLQIRAYNVQFGDAILISVPDRDLDGTVKTRHILIDVGNVLCKAKGGADEVFKKVMDNVLELLDDQPLDLYIMTHEHLDHVQGLFYGEKKIYGDEDVKLSQKLQTRYAWLTASAHEKYYDNHPEAKERHLDLLDSYEEIDRYLKALRTSGEPIPDVIEALWANNNPRSTKDCVKHLQNISDADHTYYVHREFNPQGCHPFTEAKIEIWAPEENTAVYYGRFKPLPMGIAVTTEREGEDPSLTEFIPPSGVDAGAFYNLVSLRRRIFENMLTIDKAANNTSIVFCLEWRGIRLLFTGDAEIRSWKTMNSLRDEEKVLKPVHFLKVSHHGSETGTPDPDLLDEILPENISDNTPRYALVSTWDGTYHNVPDNTTLELIRSRCDKLYDTREETSVGEYIDIRYEA